jgi:hypothetical protein
MPNWATNRLILTGPADEIAHFVSLCIRPQIGEESEEIGFDFSALVPAPPEIEALLSGTATAEQRIAAHAATGFDDWFTWRMSKWGTKLNAAHHHVIAHTGDRYDFRFDTGWSCPQPIFRALAQTFPALTGFVFAIEESDGRACVGLLAGGTFREIGLEVSPELQFIVHEAPSDPGPAEATSRSIAAVADDLCGPPSLSVSGVARNPESLLHHVWRSICEAMPGGFSPRFQLRQDIQGFLEWQEGIADGYWAEEDQSELSRLVTSSSNRLFLESSKCFLTDLDCRLMGLLSEHLIVACIRDMGQAGNEAEWSRLARALAEASSEDTLLDWAPRAILRYQVHVDMHSHGALQRSFVAYAHEVLADIEIHLAGQVASAPTFRRCGYREDLTSWDEDDPNFGKYWELVGNLRSQFKKLVVPSAPVAAGQHSITPQTTPNISR